MRRVFLVVVGLAFVVIGGQISVHSASPGMPATNGQSAALLASIEPAGSPVANPTVAVTATLQDAFPEYDPGECTWWAWTRAGQTGWSVPESLGDGGQWDDNAPSHGLSVDSVPMGGAIMVLDPGCDGVPPGTPGHVAFVEEVHTDGTLRTSECNWHTPECEGQCPCVHDRSAPLCAKYIYRPYPTFFEHVDYAGAWRDLTSGLGNFEGLFYEYPEGNGVGLNDTVSSVWMPPDWSGFLYKNGDYGCGSVIVDCPNDNLHSVFFNDAVVVGDNTSSIKLFYAVCVGDWVCGGTQADCTGPTGRTSHGTKGTNSSHACPPPEPPPPPPPCVDKATFVVDVTYPDGTIVSAGENMNKVWRVRNSGTCAWDGYQLIFDSGNQMSGPDSVAIGHVEPNATVDISVPLIAPNAPGTTQTGYWRIVDDRGTWVQSGLLWISVYIEQSGSQDGIEVVNLNYPRFVHGGDSFVPHVTIRLFDGYLRQSDGDMLRNIDGNTYGAWPHVAVVGTVGPGDTYTFDFYPDHPMVAPGAPAEYHSVWRVWRGGTYVGPAIDISFRTFEDNHPPNVPTLTAPGDWAVGYSPPTLCVQHNGDPDGDPITDYRFEIYESQQNWDSGWTTNNCVTPPSLPVGGYQWHARVRDARGGESDYSITWHFSVLQWGCTIDLFTFNPSSPSAAEQVTIHTIGSGNCNETMIDVNAATDGSTSGAWHRVQHYAGGGDVTTLWGTLEFDDGTHLVRYTWRGVAGEVQQEQQYTLLPRRPGPPFLIAPKDNVWLNSRTVSFYWQPALRAQQYLLRVSTDPNPDINPILEVTLPSDTLNYTYEFDQDYQSLYWKVKAISGLGETEGNTWKFGIDRFAPQAAVSTLADPQFDTKFTISWGGTDNTAGIEYYDVQYRDDQRGEWIDWFNHVAFTTAIFSGQAGHRYYFQARAVDRADNVEEFPGGDGDASTLINPAAAPPEAWWNFDYAFKRNVVILNNDTDTMPVSYPVRVHFDSTTVPTAAEMYDASQSGTKGDDFRMVYNNTTELHRFVQTFSSSEINIWFPIQAELGSQQSTSAYQLYYGNPGAVSPPSDINVIFPPVIDGNTVAMWHFQEGAGGTVYDTSGNGHHGPFHSGQWGSGFWGTTGVFNGTNAYVDIGTSNDFNIASGPMTVETWLYLTALPGNHPMIVSKRGSYVLKINGDRQVNFSMVCSGGDRSVQTGDTLELNRWYHIAATYDGTSVMKIYINGVERAYNTNGADAFPSGNPFLIGRSDDNPNSCIAGWIQHLRISNTNRTDFPYGRVDIAPAVEVGSPFTQPGHEKANLVIQDLKTYAGPSGGIIVQAVARNEGVVATTNGFFTDLYSDHVPSGPGDLNGTIRFWVDNPVEPGGVVTLTTVITGGTMFGDIALLDMSRPTSEVTHTLYSQVDSTGVVAEDDDQNNISPGCELCVAAPDAYESDDSWQEAGPLAPGASQTHNFGKPSDQDWLYFQATQGMTYTVRTSNLGQAADTYLYLYDNDGSTLLAANDDHGGGLASRLEWMAPADGTYYVLVKHWNPGTAGCGTTYSISLNGTRVYLPLVLKGRSG